MSVHLNNHLAKILSGDLYTQLREGSKKVLSNIPPIKELAKKTEEHLKGMVSPATIFEEFGFNYIGPMDGHNVIDLVETLTQYAFTFRPTISTHYDQKRERL